MKKLLLISNAGSVFSLPVQRAFLSLGLDVRMIDYWGNDILMPGKFIHGITERLPYKLKSWLKKKAQNGIDAKIIKTAGEYQPDFILTLKGKNISCDTLDELRKLAKTANWYPETFDHQNSIKKIISHYDFFFDCDPELVKSLKESSHKNAHYLPFCADIAKDSDLPDLNSRRYNVSFVGSFMPMRYTQRETILSQIKDLGLNIWGNKAWLGTSLKDYYRGRPSDEEMAEIYKNSKIVINIDLMQGVPGTGVNLRPFEVTSAGALLMNHDDRKDIFNLFEEGKEFISFRGPEDIRAKVLYYLDHEHERHEISRAGFERTKNNHTYSDRVETIYGILNQ